MYYVSAVFVSYRSVIMAELFGIEKLTSSFGLVTMCQGLSAFIGAPLAGINSYLWTLYIYIFKVFVYMILTLVFMLSFI